MQGNCIERMFFIEFLGLWLKYFEFVLVFLDILLSLISKGLIFEVFFDRALSVISENWIFFGEIDLFILRMPVSLNFLALLFLGSWSGYYSSSISEKIIWDSSYYSSERLLFSPSLLPLFFLMIYLILFRFGQNTLWILFARPVDSSSTMISSGI